jgi:hypothetical protein
LGVAYGAYALLEELGFAFLHPLAPLIPHGIATPTAAIARSGAPRWPVRGFQIHTMHPLELAELLNGFGPGGADDDAGWRAMLPEWERYLEWAVANRQNHVHWVLLESDTWSSFATSPVRQSRLQQLVQSVHDFGLLAGADVPIALQQQHAFRLITQTGTLSDELAQIHDRIDWLMAAGFDYLATENGTTEFTHPDDRRMLIWMDEVARWMDVAHHKPALIKAHASTGQTAPDFIDPSTGQPINFNFLPHFADTRLGVMPHTVETYALDDPAPTYGNTDFGYMRAFLQREAGRRSVIWHPETAYWISFDINVPLFLPVYAQNRLHDLRLIASDEDMGLVGTGTLAGSKIQGQIDFSSGWEWGYWLNDVVTARAAYDPLLGEVDETSALSASLDPIVRPFGAAKEQVRALLLQTMSLEKTLLIDGIVGGVAPQDIVRRNGQAYLQGFAAADDLSDLASSIPGMNTISTEPDRLGLVTIRSPLHGPPSYDQLRPLLQAMATEFDAVFQTASALAPQIPPEAAPLFSDLTDALEMTSLRAAQVYGLYDYVTDTPAGMGRSRLSDARAALDRAATVVQGREAHYRVPASRIASWRDNPTAYPYTYLWTAHSLYFWWRDEGKAVDAPLSPCYLNIVNPVQVGLGEGLLYDATLVLQTISNAFPLLGGLSECLTAPTSEPTFPQDNLRSRP